MRTKARPARSLALLVSVAAACQTGGHADPEPERAARPPAEPAVAAATRSDDQPPPEDVRGAEQPPLEEPRKPVTLTSATVLRPETAAWALAKFLEAWRDQDWEEMVHHTQKSWRSTQPDPVRLLRGWYQNQPLLEIHIGVPQRRSAVVAEVPAIVRYSFWNQVSRKQIVARVIRESAPYQPSTRGDWGVNPYSLREKDVE